MVTTWSPILYFAAWKRPKLLDKQKRLQLPETPCSIYNGNTLFNNNWANRLEYDYLIQQIIQMQYWPTYTNQVDQVVVFVYVHQCFSFLNELLVCVNLRLYFLCGYLYTGMKRLMYCRFDIYNMQYNCL